MSTVVTLGTLVIAVAVFLWKRPCCKRTKEIWGLCVLSGVVGLLVPGGAFAMQAVQSLLQGLLASCCLLAVKKEYRLRARYLHACHLRAALPQQQRNPEFANCVSKLAPMRESLTLPAGGFILRTLFWVFISKARGLQARLFCRLVTK